MRTVLTPRERARNVTAVLGPTNTGKTHLAIERMLGHDSGMIGLPLRLLAREVYQRVVDKAGVQAVALITGEEKIKPPGARYWVCTVEAMPRDLDVSFVAIDEIQLAANFDRGHVFTDRLLNRRGRGETLLIGAATMKPVVENLLPGVHVVSRPRLSQLTFAGEKKITRLPPRSVIVAFSVENVYEIAELIRRQRGGAAVVLGALSPRTRNAQVELFQSGDVDYLVATDAIGMGLNLDVDHVAFSSDRKYDGFGFRRLTPAEFGQIAGRAGRHMRDGTFGTTGRCDGMEPELVEQIEAHHFDPLRLIQWRNSALDFTSIERLIESLQVVPSEPGLTRAPAADDLIALETVARDFELRRLIQGKAAVEKMWEVCQVPDYRKVSPAAHAELVQTIALSLLQKGLGRHTGFIDVEWFSRQVKLVDRTDGDIDTLSNRIAQIRTWTFVANRPDWLRDPEHWQGVTRAIEDRLSDALHERLAQRFVDRRTSVLMRRLRENAMLETQVSATGDVTVEGQHVGQLQGFRFVADAQGETQEAKALRAAAAKALSGEIETRAAKLAAAPDEQFALASDGSIRWTGEPVAKLGSGERVLTPRVNILADETLTGAALEGVQKRLDLFVTAHIKKLLGPLQTLEDGDGLTGVARGIAFQIGEALGVLDRGPVSKDLKSLDQDARGSLRKLGVRFGAYTIYLPALLKPAPRALAAQLWALKHGEPDTKGVDDVPRLAASGRTSIVVDTDIPRDLYRAAGFRVVGPRAVRVDILERLADLIRPAMAYRPGETIGTPPAGAADGETFVVTVAMTSLAGCSGEDFASILRGLGYQSETREGTAITRPILMPAATEPVQAVAAEPADAAGTQAPVIEAEGDAAPVAEAVMADAALAEPAADAPVADVAAVDNGAPVASEPAVAVADAAADHAADGPVSDGLGSEVLGSEVLASEVLAGAVVEPAAEAAAPVTVEVWRMVRQPREHQHRARHGQRDGQREGRERGSFRKPAGERSFAPRGEGQPHGEAAPQGDARTGESKPGERRDFRPRHTRNERGTAAPHEGGDNREQTPRAFAKKAGAPGGAFGKSGNPAGDMRGDRGNRDFKPRGDFKGSGDFRKRNDEPRVFSAQPPREKKADPDSPFAKLAALKAKLEGKE